MIGADVNFRCLWTRDLFPFAMSVVKKRQLNIRKLGLRFHVPQYLPIKFKIDRNRFFRNIWWLVIVISKRQNKITRNSQSDVLNLFRSDVNIVLSRQKLSFVVFKKGILKTLEKCDVTSRYLFAYNGCYARDVFSSSMAIKPCKHIISPWILPKLYAVYQYISLNLEYTRYLQFQVYLNLIELVKT